MPETSPTSPIHAPITHLTCNCKDLFSNLSAPRGPAYNTSRGQLGKTQHVAQNPPFTKEVEKFVDIHFRDRWRSIVGA